MPFGISSAPEHFQKRINEILSGLPGVMCLIDDILIHGNTQEEHDKHLQAALECIQLASAILNKEKYEFSKASIKSSIKFLGHIITPEGIFPDPSKTTAVKKHEAAFQCFRTPSIPGHGEPLRKIFTQHSRSHKTIERATE